MKKVILVGFMGSGKSTIGWTLAKKMNSSFFEMDSEIEKRAEQSITEIFATSGEATFRALETEILNDALKKGGVIATGGGILTQDVNHDILKEEETVIYLKGNIDNLYSHIKKDKGNRRPLAENTKKEELSDLLKHREVRYEAVADIVMTIDDKEIHEIVSEIMFNLEEMAK